MWAQTSGIGPSDREHRLGRVVQPVAVLLGVGVDAGGEGVDVGPEVRILRLVPDRSPPLQIHHPG